MADVSKAPVVPFVQIVAVKPAIIPFFQFSLNT
jgi:hypothetical protein